MNIIDLDEMISRLRAGGPKRLTWVIGSGFSESAGIPLAGGICNRILVFHYLQKTGRPYLTDAIRDWTDQQIGPFLVWVEKNPDEFDHLAQAAREWAKTNVSILAKCLDDGRELYARLFQYIVPGPESTQAFLSQLMRRSPGPNLAHSFLAHILQNFPNWGHTVFTTNFDDLVIQSLMLAGHTGRMYGDITSRDEPEGDPRVPQVVHLHGRHVGYNMRNAPGEILAPNPALENAFRNHVRQSTVIVVGYGGWNDIVMKVLRDARSDAGVIRGNLYWIAYSPDTANLDADVAMLLNECTKAYLVRAGEETRLPADLFMLRMMSVWNLKPDEVIEKVQTRQVTAFQSLKQHLDQYPEFAPGRAVRLLDEARLAFGTYRYDEARAAATEALRLSKAPDQNMIRAHLLRLMGDADSREDNVDAAREHYEKALPIFREVHDRVGEANTLRSLGDLDVKEAKLEAARAHYQEALAIYRQLGSGLGEANTLQFLGDLEVREDKLEAAREHYQRALPIYREVRDRVGEANTLQSLGYLELREGKPEVARENFQLALPIFREVRERLGEANTLQSIGDLELGEGKLEAARELYEQTLAIRREIRDRLGEANTLRRLGDVEICEDKLVEARKHYEEALQVHREIRSRLGEANTLHRLGELEESEGKIEAAREHQGQALGIYREIRDRLGEANTLQGLGDLEVTENEFELARENYQQAARIYHEIKEPRGEKTTLAKLDRLRK
jgi:tetratricopeptide (TPR) repeat protein